jgi:hypothetical protein
VSFGHFLQIMVAGGGRAGGVKILVAQRFLNIFLKFFPEIYNEDSPP